jgi:CheY-like chemotaxis protein
MLRILHADDSLEDFELTRVNLARKAPDFGIFWSESAENSLKMLEQGQFDCVLRDYQMPGFNGIEPLKTMRSSGDRTPFIFFTGQGSEEIAAEALRFGADDYFSKDLGFAFYDRIVNSIKRVED